MKEYEVEVKVSTTHIITVWAEDESDAMNDVEHMDLDGIEGQSDVYTVDSIEAITANEISSCDDDEEDEI